MIPKFRVYDKKLKIIRPVSYVDFDNKEILYHITEEAPSEIVRGFDEVEIMQSTDMRFVDGTELYEGDIVETTHIDRENKPYRKRGVIGRYGTGEFVILYSELNYPNKLDWFYIPHSLYYSVGLELLGNMYENPNLLEENLRKVG